MNRLFAIGGALALGLLAAQAARAQEFTLKYAHVGPATEVSDDHIPGEFLKSFLESRSQGRIAVEIYPASQLGGFRELIEQIQLNTLELTHTTVGGMGQFFPELQVTDIPYMLENDMIAEAVGQGRFFDDVRDAILERTGNVRLVAVGNTGRWRSFFTASKPIHTADDLAGIKMRTIDSPLQMDFVKFLGGNPTPIAWGELYTSLATGVVEGTKNAATDIIPNNMHEVLKHVILDEHAYLYGFYWMSDQWLKGLPPDLQDLVIDGVIQMAAVQSEWNKQYESRSLTEFVDSGGTIYVPSAEERATFTAATDAMKQWFVDNHGEEWLIKWENAISEAKAEVQALRDRTVGRGS
ncbi:MAG TPA: TRAP transporter substrate-binding protein DctP [Geminicoccaceae bacterium]